MLQWAHLRKWELDATLHPCWQAMKPFLRPRHLTRVGSAQDTTMPGSSLLDDDPPSMHYDRWWSERNALAFAKSLGVSPGQADAVHVTKLLSRWLPVKDQCL